VWFSLNADNSYTVALFNLGQTDADMTVNWADLGLDGGTNGAKVRDLWARKDLGQFATGYTAQQVPVHGVRLFKVTPQKGASIKVNDDDLRVAYDGAWQRNNNYEVPATTQALTVGVTDGAPKTADVGTRTIEVNNNNPQITYTGSWNYSSGRGLGDYQDDVQWTETNGDAFSYTFVGTGVDYVTETDPGQGDVDIYIDGQFKQTVSTYLDPAQGHNKPQQVVYSVSDLPNGNHTIRAVKKSGQFMLLDKLNIRQESLLTPDTVAFDKSAPADATVQIGRDPGELAGISKGGVALVQGKDYTLTGSTVTLSKTYLATLPVGNTSLDFAFRGDYRDDVHAATANGSAVNFTFTGTAVQWLTALGPDQGDADVYVDGKLVQRVSLHSDTRVTNRQAFAATGLKNAQHTVRIVKVSGDALRNDVLRYTIAK
jgi:alpha-galactosidase